MTSKLWWIWGLKGKQKSKKVQIGVEGSTQLKIWKGAFGKDKGKQCVFYDPKLKNFNEVLKFKSSTKMAQIHNYLNHVNLS